MLDLFAAAKTTVREAKLQEYRAYLLERDGEMNIEARTLSKREASMKRFETPPKLVRALNEAEFRANYTSFDKRNPPSTEATLLLALVKTNAAEAYGVTRGMQLALDHALRTQDDVELRVLCEETYHTRILLSAATHYGMQIESSYRPPSALRVLIGGIVTLPPALARPLVLAGEIVGTLLFLRLLDVVRSVLKDDAETRDAIEERLLEICTDELGHISYNRMLSGPAALAQTRLVLPLVAQSLSTVLPEAAALGAYPKNVMRELERLSNVRKLPEAVRCQAFIA